MGRYEYTSYGRLVRVPDSSNEAASYRGSPLSLFRRYKIPVGGNKQFHLANAKVTASGARDTLTESAEVSGLGKNSINDSSSICSNSSRTSNSSFPNEHTTLTDSTTTNTTTNIECIPTYPGRTILTHSLWAGYQFGSLAGVSICVLRLCELIIGNRNRYKLESSGAIAQIKVFDPPYRNTWTMRKDWFSKMWRRSLFIPVSIGIVYGAYKLKALDSEANFNIRKADLKAYCICNNQDIQLLNKRCHIASLTLATIGSVLMSCSPMATFGLYSAGVGLATGYHYTLKYQTLP
jgi:hypothetical protein